MLTIKTLLKKFNIHDIPQLMNFSISLWCRISSPALFQWWCVVDMVRIAMFCRFVDQPVWQRPHYQNHLAVPHPVELASVRVQLVGGPEILKLHFDLLWALNPLSISAFDALKKNITFRRVFVGLGIVIRPLNRIIVNFVLKAPKLVWVVIRASYSNNDWELRPISVLVLFGCVSLAFKMAAVY